MGTTSNRGSGTAASRRGILVIDGLASARRTIADGLASMGFEVLQAATLAAAFKNLDEQSPFAAIVVDVALKDGSGEGFARQMRAASPASRVIVVTGYSESAMRERLSDDPCLVVLGKPVDPPALARALRDLGVEPHL